MATLRLRPSWYGFGADLATYLANDRGTAAQLGIAAASDRRLNRPRAGASWAGLLEDNMSDHAILVTGAAGFIGFHAARRLLAEGRDVVGLDSLNDYYDPALKRSRLDLLRAD